KNGEILAIYDAKTKQKWLLDTKKLSLGMADQPGGLKIELEGQKPLILKRDGKDVVTLTWDPAPKPPVFTKKGPGQIFQIPGGKGMWASALSPDGRRLLTHTWAGQASLWDLVSGKVMHQLAGWGNKYVRPSFTLNGKAFLLIGPDKKAAQL